MSVSGCAWVFGDHIDTDLLAPGAYMKSPPEELARHCLEALDERFVAAVQPGDIVVAGRQFGIGSSREQAAQSLKLLGVGAVVARSFGGIFYRNAFNLGLPLLVCDWAGIEPGDRLQLNFDGRLDNLSRAESFTAEPLPPHLLRLVAAGGLIPYLQSTSS